MSSRNKSYRLNQPGIVCNVHDSVNFALWHSAGIVNLEMTEDFFQAGKEATEVAGWWGANADHAAYDKNLHKQRLLNVIKVARQFVATHTGDVGVALFDNESQRRLERYW